MFLGLNTTGLQAKRRFSPTALFAASEQGAWFDPSDLSSMFQDSAGVTPAAVNQPVGLVLDKRQGLVRGAEQAAATYGTGLSGDNGTTATSATSFTTTAGTTIPRVYLNITAAPGAAVEVTFRVTAVSAGTVLIGLRSAQGGGGVNDAFYGGLGLGTYTVRLCPATVSAASLLWAGSVAGATMSVDSISVKVIPGAHAYQSTSLSRPTLKQDSSGNYYLEFGGSHFLQTGSIDFTATDKMTIVAGVYKGSDAASAAVCELSTIYSTNNGAFALWAPLTAAQNFGFSSFGTSGASPTASPYAAPTSAVLVGQASISTPVATIRVNGVQSAPATVTQGTGNYGNYPLYIGMRAGTSLPLTGRIYGLIVRGATSTTTEINQAEKAMADKMGISL